MSKDLYSVLGVEKDANDKTIKKAFRKLAMDYHPDRHPDDPVAEAKFKEINEAYQILSDSEKRQEYDRPSDSIPGGFRGASGFNPYDFSQSSRPDGPSKGVNVQIQVPIPFMTAVFGGMIDITVPSWSSCSCTNGKIFDASPCPGCNGAGYRGGNIGNMSVRLTCGGCNGAGRRWQSCGACGGRGQIATPTEKSLNIPAGVDDGQIISISGMGMEGRNGGPAGDLHVRLGVLPHETFERQGADIHIEMPVSYPDAVMGGKIDVPMLDGSQARVSVPAGSSGGQVMRLAGKGIQAAGRSPGHLYCHVVIDVLTDVSPEVEEALDRLSAAIQKTMPIAPESPVQSPELTQE
ncbi:J domain-containing protein [Candidatus Bathyarchaeota archaeon]|jgi:molecular chaperone DnaJ|nr:J domain-containing protein [Candidatus Bathyarchaeota archaeon]